MVRRRLISLAVLVIPTILVSTGANAQTISAGGQPYPDRLVNGTNEGTSTRPQNLNPLGISYADCMADMTLSFSVTFSGFNGNDTAEVWASLSSDCTSSTDRGIGSTTVACWGTRSGNITNPVVSNPQTYALNVRVQDLVGWQQTPPTLAQAADPPAQGPSACNAQATFAAVPININFLAIDSSGNVDGTPYQYTIVTDLVGPPAPSGLALEPGNGALLPGWTPNTDTDTVGYDVFLAPPAGQPAQGHGCPTIPGASDAGTHGAGGISNIPRRLRRARRRFSTRAPSTPRSMTTRARATRRSMPTPGKRADGDRCAARHGDLHDDAVASCSRAVSGGQPVHAGAVHGETVDGCRDGGQRAGSASLGGYRRDGANLHALLRHGGSPVGLRVGQRDRRAARQGYLHHAPGRGVEASALRRPHRVIPQVAIANLRPTDSKQQLQSDLVSQSL